MSDSSRVEEAASGELRLVSWRAYLNIVEIKHSRDIRPLVSEERRINAALGAYMVALGGAEPATRAALSSLEEGSRAAQKHARRLGLRDGIRMAVTWLHHRAASMKDEHAKIVLHSAATNLGWAQKDIIGAPSTPPPKGSKSIEGELVKRLRDEVEELDEGMRFENPNTRRTMNLLESAASEIERLRKALEVYAAMADEWEAERPDAGDTLMVPIKLTVLRAARLSLREGK